MEKYLEKNFSLPAKNSSPEALKRWRQAVSIVKNPKRRFRNVADLDKRNEAEEKKKKIKFWKFNYSKRPALLIEVRSDVHIPYSVHMNRRLHFYV